MYDDVMTLVVSIPFQFLFNFFKNRYAHIAYAFLVSNTSYITQCR